MGKRKDILKCYVDNMVDFLQPMTGLTAEELTARVQAIVKEDFKNPQLTYLHTVSEGNVTVKKTDLLTFTREIGDKIIAPSGSVYKTADEQLSFITQFILDNVNNRNKFKKLMLAATAIGDKANRQRYHYAQATTKICNNSIPGGFGSPWNGFYDKGGYNSVTSTARIAISESFLTTEQLLGGNFAFFTEEDILNYILLNVRQCPDNLADTLDRHNIKIITRTELFTFYNDVIRQYQGKGVELQLVSKVLSMFSPSQISYLFYLGNLRHLIWRNSDVFRAKIDGILHAQVDSIDPSISPDDLFKLDGDLAILISATFSDKLEGMQIWDLPKKAPDKAREFVAIGRHVQTCLDEMQELFKIFINVRPHQGRVAVKSNMWRNTVIISDTDSVIFTCKDWVKWYTGKLDICATGYFITSLAIYWLTKAIKDVLVTVSINFGITGKFIHTMGMKNEYLYPIMILYDLKKTYAGIIAIQEGIVLPKPKIDIKGANLRGSDICAESTKFVQDFISNDILKHALDSKVSAVEMIEKVVKFENGIRESLLSGSADYCKMTSLQPKEKYDHPESTNFMYAELWNWVFGDTYDILQLPLKTSIAHIFPPSPSYLDSLSRTNIKLYHKFMSFKETYQRFPNAIAIGSAKNRIPPELMPLLDIRAIVFHNIRPLYLTLNKLSIDVGIDRKQQVLLSDIY